MRRVVFFLTIFLIAAVVVDAQRSVKNPKALTKPATCEVNGLSFKCPPGFANLFKDEAKGLMLFRDNKEKDFGLFISSPNGAFDDDTLFDDLAKSIVPKLYPTQPQSYEWAKADVVRFAENETPMSAHQVSSKTVKGYNKKHLVLGNFRHVVFNEKHFVVGYFIESDKGKDAEEMFQTDFADAGYITCNAQLKLIYSITGETLKKGDDPCEVTVTMQAQ